MQCRDYAKRVQLSVWRMVYATERRGNFHASSKGLAVPVKHRCRHGEWRRWPPRRIRDRARYDCGVETGAFAMFDALGIEVLVDVVRRTSRDEDPWESSKKYRILLCVACDDVVLNRALWVRRSHSASTYPPQSASRPRGWREPRPQGP